MSSNTVEYLKNFKALFDEGLITQEEFEAKKTELLPALPEPNLDSLRAEEGKKHPVASPGDIVLIVTGSLFVLFSLMALGGIGFLTTIFLGEFDIGSLVCVAIAAVGSLELCIGLKSALDARSARADDMFVAGKRFEDKNVL